MAEDKDKDRIFYVFNKDKISENLMNDIFLYPLQNNSQKSTISLRFSLDEILLFTVSSLGQIMYVSGRMSSMQQFNKQDINVE